MRGDYDALVTMDASLEFQENISTPPFGVALIRAPSNRMVHLQPLVPAILEAIAATKPGQLQRARA